MATADNTQPGFNVVKLLLALALLSAGIVGFYYYKEQYILLYRVLALLGVILVSLGVFYQTQWGRSLWSYMQDARTELRKVVWPTRAETTQTTLVVAVVVVVVGIFLWLLDLLFGWLVQALLAL